MFGKQKYANTGHLRRKGEKAKNFNNRAESTKTKTGNRKENPTEQKLKPIKREGDQRKIGRKVAKQK